eukprot:253766-Rhodomonas_salina.2
MMIHQWRPAPQTGAAGALDHGLPSRCAVTLPAVGNAGCPPPLCALPLALTLSPVACALRSVDEDLSLGSSDS